MSSSGPQKIICASSSVAFSSFFIFAKVTSLTTGSNSSECVMFGFSRQAITFSRSHISPQTFFPVEYNEKEYYETSVS